MYFRKTRFGKMLENVFKLFTQQYLQKNNCRTIYAVSAKTKVFDPLQVESMKEQCILVNANDEPIGFASKENCHRVNKDHQVKMHRAFSVFLFNRQGELLIQRRSKNKITFPDMYTNTCCSHPLYDIEEERTMLNALGVRKAAIRRLNYELGIPSNQLQLKDFHYLTRIHYSNLGDGIWGENEIDYILVVQKDVDVKANKNEVSEVCYIKRDNFDEAIKKFQAPLTPWFKLMCHHGLLTLWWDNLNQLEKFNEHNKIQQLT